MIEEEHRNAYERKNDRNKIALFKALAKKQRRENDDEYRVGKLQDYRVCGGRELIGRYKGDINKPQQQSGNYRAAVYAYSVAFYAYVCKHRQSRKKAAQSRYNKRIPRYELYKYSCNAPKCRAH